MSVTYNEDSTSYTMAGGIASIMMKLGIFAFGIMKLQLCLTRSRNGIITTNVFRPFPEEGQYKLRDSGFKFWAQVADPTFDNDSNPYAKLKFYVYNTERDF